IPARRGWFELLRLLLELAHLELTADRQFLEPLELRKPLELLVPLLGDFGLGLLLRGHVAGGREYAQDVAAGVVVNRGVVQDLGQMALSVTDRQRAVGHGALGENLLVTLAGFCRLGGLVAETGPDARSATHAA